MVLLCRCWNGPSTMGLKPSRQAVSIHPGCPVFVQGLNCTCQIKMAGVSLQHAVHSSIFIHLCSYFKFVKVVKVSRLDVKLAREMLIERAGFIMFVMFYSSNNGIILFVK